MFWRLVIRVCEPSSNFDVAALPLRLMVDRQEIAGPVTPTLERRRDGFSLCIDLTLYGACPKSLKVSGLSLKKLGEPKSVYISLHDSQGAVLADEVEATFKHKSKRQRAAGDDANELIVEESPPLSEVPVQHSDVCPYPAPVSH